MKLLKKQYEDILLISLTYLYPGELKCTKISSAVLVEILAFISIDI